jgi:hypothetical protein
MRYLPTIDLWDGAIHAALINGQLRLLPGQWIKCGGGEPSRFIRVTRSKSIQAVHPAGVGVTRSRFKQALECWPR